MRRRSIGWLELYGLLFIALLYGPMLLLPLFSFNDSLYIAFPFKGFTVKWYEAMVQDSALLAALRNSLSVAIPVSIVSTAFGLLTAKALTRFRLPGRRAIVGLIMVPLVIPFIILGIALLTTLRKTFDVPLSLWTVAAGHILICLPFSVMVLISRLEGFDRSLEEASLDLGESAWSTFWRITFPIVLPGVVSSLLMCFTASFDEFLIAFFLSGDGATLPVFIWSQLRFPQKLPNVLALGSCILVLSFLLIAIAEKLRRGGIPTEKHSGF
ncbi:ABC transporter permease [Dongia deserti]|uniref:ABC transporter permease n=1 Tax=Dongia deserti TaxID=2268030 RepID=UPI000E64C564|nr:ABC transporter permease [Dongia deserti]